MFRFARCAAISAIALVAAGAVEAACYVDYKARIAQPFQLHYGVIRLSDAECADPRAAVQARIGVDGWEVLAIMDQFDEAGAEARRNDAAGFYLRY
ncbi:hypothetical protein SAMN04488012_103106 [Palleronia salina]|uniref:Lipoprotein n=2 Tax=Palleronia TaxID=315422 RepID=A0A1M6EI80_9RHOB|nr:MULTISPECIES: hypothetical protein [Palleronia]SEN74524.1 hypothetical protein SAMN04488011_10626 [Palleronia pelagia]SHI85176.1 hypothetical protein SAMN04488012_103106 [Palleronia salina]